MKNKFSLATLIAMVIVTISCTTDIEEVNSTSQKQNDGVYLKKIDSGSQTPSTNYAGATVIIPPIKP